MMSLPVDCILHASNHKTCVVNGIIAKHAFYDYSPQVCNLPEETSCLQVGQRLEKNANEDSYDPQGILC